MESEAITVLNSIGIPLGTIIACIVMVFCFLSWMNKQKKLYDESIARHTLEKEDDKEFRNEFNELTASVAKLSDNMNKMYETFMDDSKKTHEQLNNMNDSIVQIQRSSNEGDERLQKQIQEIDRNIQIVSKKSDLLIESDKEGIKAYITDKYYKAVDEGYINLHTLQTLEVRYDKYLQENGNTFIAKLMNVLRELPNEPQLKEMKEDE